MLRYPSTLPFFDQHPDFQKTGPLNATIRTNMSNGPAKTRRRFTAAVENFTTTTGQMTKAQLIEFESFYRNDLLMGSLEFKATSPVYGTEKSFRFVDGYSVKAFGPGFKVSATLEVLP